MKKLNVGVIGAGYISTIHIPNICKSDKMNLLWLADIDENKLKERLQNHVPLDKQPSLHTTTNPDKIFRDADVDAVVICASPTSHKELSLKACQAKKHVFMEKPLALRTADCQEIIKAVDNAGIKFMVGYWFRSLPLVSRVKMDIPSPYMVLARCAIGGVINFDPSVCLEDNPLGRQGLLDQAGYCFDLSYFLIGSEPVSVFSQTPARSSVASTSSTLVKFANGAVANIIYSTVGSGGFLGKWFFEIYGGKSSATINGFTSLTYGDKSRDEVRDNQYLNGPNYQMEMFADCVLNDKPAAVDVREGSVATLIVEKAILSMKTAKPERIDLAMDLMKGGKHSGKQ